MTLAAIKATIMHQTNNDQDDLADYLPFVIDYINDAYDRLYWAFKRKHVATRLAADTDTPDIPEWAHYGLADWATWLMYRNGNVNKQQRGMQFKYSFEELLRKIYDQRGDDGNGGTRQIHNIPW